MTDEKKNSANQATDSIRTVRSEKIKGVDVMVNRAIEKILSDKDDVAMAQTGNKANAASRKTSAPQKGTNSNNNKPEQRKANPNKNRPKTQTKASDGGKSQTKQYQAGNRSGGKSNSSHQKRKLTKKMIIHNDQGVKPVSSSQAFISNPLARIAAKIPPSKQQQQQKIG